MGAESGSVLRGGGGGGGRVAAPKRGAAELAAGESNVAGDGARVAAHVLFTRVPFCKARTRFMN